MMVLAGYGLVLPAAARTGEWVELFAGMLFLAMGKAGTALLWRPSRVHKRIWSSGHEGYLPVESLNRLNATVCGGAAGESADIRHKYGIDPWGSPYWLLVERDERGHRVMVYSFGPNRRREVPTSETTRTDIGDDILASRVRRLAGAQ